MAALTVKSGYRHDKQPAADTPTVTRAIEAAMEDEKQAYLKISMLPHSVKKTTSIPQLRMFGML